MIQEITRKYEQAVASNEAAPAPLLPLQDRLKDVEAVFLVAKIALLRQNRCSQKVADIAINGMEEAIESLIYFRDLEHAKRYLGTYNVIYKFHNMLKNRTASYN